MRNSIFAQLAKHATIIGCVGVLATNLAHGNFAALLDVPDLAADAACGN
jgi:hypothetical protein